MTTIQQPSFIPKTQKACRSAQAFPRVNGVAIAAFLIDCLDAPNHLAMSLSTDRLYCLVGASTLAAAAGAAFMWAASVSADSAEQNPHFATLLHLQAASAGTWIRPGKSSTKLVKEDVLSALHECKALLGPVHVRRKLHGRNDLVH